MNIEKKVIVFDIDGTLFDSVFERSRPEAPEGKYTVTGYNVKMMEAVNDLYYQGYRIIMQTARHWDKYQQTIIQLQGFKYHSLVMGNIPADIYVNDKGMSPDGFIKFYEANLRREVNHV